MAMKKRIEWVDVYKGILILSVILGHAIQEVLKVRGMAFEDNFWRNLIYSFHMPAFMAMSGFVAYSGMRGGGRIALVIKRFRQLMVPFAIWSIPLFVIYHNVNHIWEYIIYPNKGYWFLWALFFIIVIFSGVDYVCQKFKLRQELCMLFAAGVLMGGGLVLTDAKWFGYEYIAFYFLFYLMGYYANKYNTLLPSKSFICALLFILWFCLACFWMPNGIPFFLENLPLPTALVKMGYRILPPIVFIFAMYCIVPKIRTWKSWVWQLLMELGKTSLGIYVVHMVVKNLFAYCLLIMLPNSQTVIHVLLLFLILTYFSLCVVKVLLKNWYTARWLFGK